MTTRRYPESRFILVAAVAIAALLLPASVVAHAELLETTPADGATVEGTPTEVSATFSEALEEDGSTLELRDRAGDSLATGGLDPDDPARLLIADVPELAPGEYEVRWRTATDDGHSENDTWTFTVTAEPTPSPSPSPTPAPSVTAPPSAAPTASPSVAPSLAPSPSPTPTGASDSDVLLPIVAGLAIVAVAGALLLSRRNRPVPPAPPTPPTTPTPPAPPA